MTTLWLDSRGVVLLMPHTAIQHGPQTTPLRRGVPKHLLPDILAFHAEVDTGSGISKAGQLISNELIHFHPLASEITGLAVQPFDKLLIEEI